MTALASATATQLPPLVAPYAGRIVDADSHEMMPAQIWVEAFGEAAKPIAELIMAKPGKTANDANIPGYVADTEELRADSLWTTKGPASPGAVDMERRLRVMDMMGIESQLLFATSVGLWGMVMINSPEDNKLLLALGGDAQGGYKHARRLMDAHNEWLVGVARNSPRIKAIAPVHGDTVEELIARARWAIEHGMAGIWITSGLLPGGVSPAHSLLDPFYAMLAEAGVALHFHIGGLGPFLGTNKWRDAPAFDGFKSSAEISLDPWWLSAVHLSVQNFIATLVTGAVFDRHPNLYVASEEHTAHWIGPLAHMLDIWHDNNNSLHERQYVSGPPGRKLPMRPSDYIRRNVRVSPFDFEPVGDYLDKYGLDTVYCFASDYPHAEGGSDPMGKFTAQLERFGPEMFEKFFVTNGRVLFPK
jgi:predicted TIM-barrel fold metal-dependent hydrolase